MTGIGPPVAALDLVPLLLRAVSNQKICMLLTLDGPIDLQILRRAQRYLLQQNPVLASELVLNRGKPLWRYRAERVRQAAPQLCVTDVPGELLVRHPKSLLAGKGDTLEIRVFRGARHDALCITTDHTAADAAGCREIVRQLCGLYTQLQGGGQILVDTAAARSRDLASVRAQLGTLRSLRSLLRPGMAPPQWQFGRAEGSQPAAPVYLLRCFDAAGKGGLQAISRRYKATINDLLLAALLRALLATRRAGNARHLPLQLTVDLRRYLLTGQRARIANLSGTDHVWLDTARARRFAAVVADSHAAMRRVKNCNPGAGSSLWLNLLLALGFRRGQQFMQKAFAASRHSGRANPMLTNFGSLDRSVTAFGTTSILSASLIAPSLLAPGLVIGASSFRNSLTLSAGVDANIANPEWVGEVLDRMVSDLGTDP